MIGDLKEDLQVEIEADREVLHCSSAREVLPRIEECNRPYGTMNVDFSSAVDPFSSKPGSTHMAKRTLSKFKKTSILQQAVTSRAKQSKKDVTGPPVSSLRDYKLSNEQLPSRP